MRHRVRLFYVLVGAFVIAACSLMVINRLDGDIAVLQDTVRETRLRQLAVEAEKSDMQQELAIKDTDSYIREMARTQYGYLMPGEIYFKVVNPEVLYDAPETAVAEAEETP